MKNKYLNSQLSSIALIFIDSGLPTPVLWFCCYKMISLACYSACYTSSITKTQNIEMNILLFSKIMHVDFFVFFYTKKTMLGLGKGFPSSSHFHFVYTQRNA